VFPPVTVKTTVTPGVGLPSSSVTVAVTQCSTPAGFVSSVGSRVIRAGTAAVSSFATKASRLPLCVVSKAPGVVGKLVERVSPATYVPPAASSAIPLPASSFEPPRYVE
jgi:hypothetical protein